MSGDEATGTRACGGELRWQGDYPITRNKTVNLSLLAVSTISVGLVGLLLIGLAVNDGNYEFAGTLIGIVAAIWFGFTAVLFLIGLVFFGGKVPMEVVIDNRGIVQEIHSRRAKVANLLAVVGGGATGGAGGATAAGAGLLAGSRQVEGRTYADLRSARGNPKTGEIRLWDDWHTVLQVFAPPEHYEEAMRRLESGIARAAARRRPGGDIPVAVKALVGLGAILFGTFLLAGFPLGMPSVAVAAMVALTITTILIRPAWRSPLGWMLAGLVTAGVVTVFRMDPPALSEAGSGLVLGIQLAVYGLFVLFGVCAGLRVFHLESGRERVS